MRLARQRGDTIVEVLFAVAVFAMVAVGSMTIMNQATGVAQRSLEITLVREQIDAQAEAIRFAHKSYVADYQAGKTPTGTAAEWVEMTSTTAGKGASTASAFGQTNGDQCLNEAPGERPFILNARTAKVSNTVPEMVAPEGSTLPPFAQVVYNADSSINAAYGIWIEAVPSVSTNQTGFVDFHIRACWLSTGSSAPVTLGTIVRLYEPR